MLLSRWRRLEALAADDELVFSFASVKSLAARFMGGGRAEGHALRRCASRAPGGLRARAHGYQLMRASSFAARSWNPAIRLHSERVETVLIHRLGCARFCTLSCFAKATKPSQARVGLLGVSRGAGVDGACT